MPFKGTKRFESLWYLHWRFVTSPVTFGGRGLASKAGKSLENLVSPPGFEPGTL